MLHSLALLLILGLLFARLVARAGLPGFLGYIIVGVLLGPFGLDLLAPSLLAISGDLRLLALVVILLRAGLGISRSALAQVGGVALRMAAIPCLVEGLTIAFVASWLLGLPLLEAALLGFILAAVSPAVVVPETLRLQDRGYGEAKGVPVIILGGASIDDVFAITIFTALLGLATNPGESSLALQALQIPLQVGGGVMLGLAVGYGLSWILGALGRFEALLLAVGAALAVTWAGQVLPVSGLLAVMTMGFLLLERLPQVASELSIGLGQIWQFAQLFLFALIGAEVNIRVAWAAGLAGVLVIVLGLLGRSLGVFLATAGSSLSWRERLFCAIAYTPKATVQAAIGGLPLAAGLASGQTILAVAVLAIVLTAPLGAIGIRQSAPVLLEGDT